MSPTLDTLNRNGPKPVTLLAIRRAWWKNVAGQAPVWLVVIFSGPLVWFHVRSPWFWGELLCASGLLALALPVLLARARLPVFAIREDGIQLPAFQYLPGAIPSTRNWRDLGLFTWDQVGECRWSRYTPGLLVIMIVVSRAEGKFENPPARLEYRVPEPHRSAVQQAIRSMGKWAD
jgi:hypothetical protein